jgi:hypothetical protein
MVFKSMENARIVIIVVVSTFVKIKTRVFFGIIMGFLEVPISKSKGLGFC